MAERSYWGMLAACREGDQEMVCDERQDVVLAKKICAECPVVSECLAAAERIATTFGWTYAQGIWGGLTLAERNTMAVLGRGIEACPQCGMPCVPVNWATDRCSVCEPGARVSYDDYRPKIEAMVEAGATYQEIADALRMMKAPLASICYRWNLKAKRSSRRGKCGTLAAKEQHRRHGESWHNCACRHVAWRRGKYRSQGR